MPEIIPHFEKKLLYNQIVYIPVFRDMWHMAEEKVCQV